VAAIPSSNSWAVSHPRSSTHSVRKSAMWAGGPPNPIAPMRPHSRTRVLNGTGWLGNSGMLRAIVRSVPGRRARPTSWRNRIAGGDLLQ